MKSTKNKNYRKKPSKSSSNESSSDDDKNNNSLNKTKQLFIKKTKQLGISSVDLSRQKEVKKTTKTDEISTFQGETVEMNTDKLMFLLIINY